MVSFVQLEIAPVSVWFCRIYHIDCHWHDVSQESVSVCDGNGGNKRQNLNAFQSRKRKTWWRYVPNVTWRADMWHITFAHIQTGTDTDIWQLELWIRYWTQSRCTSKFGKIAENLLHKTNASSGASEMTKFIHAPMLNTLNGPTQHCSSRK